MSDISVIIVNYNVEFFLQQCIASVKAASVNLEVDIIVVDNASVDNSLNMLKREFPEVSVIANHNNVGFAKANNQGIAVAEGKYTLLLNPDTLVQEDTLLTCFNYAEQHPNVGAIGVKLVDGRGHFLPESKRGFPTVSASFFKVTGIHKLFKHSSLFNAYYAGSIGENETGLVDVLCGAFMFMPTQMLRSVGMLDEDYFMYGEDIDLSYMIGKSGKEVVYLPTTKTIHYKGESTKKSSKNYNNAFYGAMQIFIKKHFKSTSSSITLFFLQIAITLLSLFAGVKHKLGTLVRLFVDVGITFGLGHAVTSLWATQYYQNAEYFSNAPYSIGLSMLCLLLIVTLYLIGHYDEDGKKKRFLPSMFILAMVVLVIYSIVPEAWRFSRLLVLSYVIIGALVTFATRVVRNRLLGKSLSYDIENERSIIVIGMKESIKDLIPIIKGDEVQIQGNIFPSTSKEYDSTFYVSNVTNLDDLIPVLNINEVIFCSKDISMKEILSIMTKLGSGLKYKIANASNDNYLGSDDKNRPGTWHTTEIAFSINTSSNRRLKRSFDILTSIIHIIIIPYMLVRSKLTRRLMMQTVSVLFGQKTLIGYDEHEALPTIKQSVIKVTDVINTQSNDQSEYNYCREYSIWNDINIWINSIIYG